MLEKFEKFEIQKSKKNTVTGGSQSGAPGAGVNIRVRGIGNINADNDPLIIID